MHGMNNVKVINVQHARNIHKYKNTKEKLFKTDATNVCSIKRAGSNI
jgi:hypothetical protein